MKVFRICILQVCCLLLFSCTEDKEESEIKHESDFDVDDEKSFGGISAGGVQFKITYDKPRQIYRIESVDLNNNGIDEVIVLSVIKEESELDFTSFYNFDMIQVFTLDSNENNYVKILSDTVDYSVQCSYRNLRNDGQKQVIVKTNTGGNNVIASAGMIVYDMNDRDSLKLIKRIDYGDPEIQDINKDGVFEIVVKDYYWGTMTHIDLINFVKDIYVMEGDGLERRNSDYGNFFNEKINDTKKRYDDTKNKIQSGVKISPTEYPLYKECAEIVINYWSKDDGTNLKKFWDEESSFLKKNLPEDQFVDLQNFIKNVIPIG
jgi:hypothetical protein